MLTEWPAWARELNLDTKWAEGVETLEIDGCEFLVVSRYGLDRSATIALVGDACEQGFRFQILPRHNDGEQIEILIWKE